jgi:hypothetical protein
MRQKWNEGANTYVADYFYDESGAPFGFAYSINGADFQYYFYETNLQGDIIAIYDINATKVATFSYDAWGYVVYSRKTRMCKTFSFLCFYSVLDNQAVYLF